MICDAVDQAFGTIIREFISRTDLFIKLAQTFQITGRCIFLKRLDNLGLLTEKIDDFLIGSETKGSDQNGNRYFTLTVNMNIEDIGGVRLVFQPCASIGNYRA